MPELPEVESARHRLEQAALGRRITEVFVASDPLWLCGESPKKVKGRLTGRKVESTGRKGKYFWMGLDRRPWPILHFGMSGELSVYKEESARLPHTKLELLLEGGERVGIRDPRRFGRLKFAQDPQDLPSIARLGFDALAELPPAGEFFEKVRNSKRGIKALLLDQSFSAGVGNWIADEVLYQAGIDPRRRTGTLDRAESDRLRLALHKVLQGAVRAYERGKEFPSDWLFHVRWTGKVGKTRAGERMVRETVAGRTTAWVPKRQK